MILAPSTPSYARLLGSMVYMRSRVRVRLYFLLVQSIHLSDQKTGPGRVISHDFGPALPIPPAVFAPQRSPCRQIARLRLFTLAHRFSSTALCYERCTALFKALKLPMNTVKTREHGWIDAEQHDPFDLSHAAPCALHAHSHRSLHGLQSIQSFCSMASTQCFMGVQTAKYSSAFSSLNSVFSRNQPHSRVHFIAFPHSGYYPFC